MLEKIIAKISEKYDMTSNRGVFFSLFDKNKNLLSSNGVLLTDRPLEEIITKLYSGLVEKQLQTKFIGIDIIGEIQQETDPQNIQTLDTKKYGVYVYSGENDSTGVLLPNTAGIENIPTAIQTINKKTPIGGQAQIYSFKTERVMFLIEK